MKKLLLAATILAASTGFAIAADLPSRVVRSTPYVPVDPALTWGGFYVGGNAGYGWGKSNDAMTLGGRWLTDGTGDNVPLSSLGNDRLKPHGFTGGIHTGYNYQVGQWVLGIEADANYIRMRKRLSNGPFTVSTSGDIYTFTSSFESNWLITARPRIGYALDRFFVYATGGLAIANQRLSRDTTQFNIAYNEQGSVSKTSIGWAVGVGAEYAFDDHLSAKAECLYIDLGSVSFASRGDIDPGYTSVHSAQLKSNIIRLGINYRFN